MLVPRQVIQQRGITEKKPFMRVRRQKNREEANPKATTALFMSHILSLRMFTLRAAALRPLILALNHESIPASYSLDAAISRKPCL